MLLKLKNVKKNYKINKNEVQEVLKDINLTLKSAELFVFMEKVAQVNQHL